MAQPQGKRQKEGSGHLILDFWRGCKDAAVQLDIWELGYVRFCEKIREFLNRF